MKTQYFSATSLDGFLATEDDSLDWLFPLGDVSDTSYSGFIAEVGALVMGATTYEWLLLHASKVKEDMGSAWQTETYARYTLRWSAQPRAGTSGLSAVAT
jgi:dihydrofolate reductase